jgi:hypothetical protein
MLNHDGFSEKQAVATDSIASPSPPVDVKGTFGEIVEQRIGSDGNKQYKVRWQRSEGEATAADTWVNEALLPPMVPLAADVLTATEDTVVANVMRPHWRTVEEMKDGEPAENGGCTRKCMDLVHSLRTVRTCTLCCSPRVRSQRKCTLCCSPHVRSQRKCTLCSALTR